MVARNVSVPLKGKKGGPNSKKGFQVLTRKGMKHVGKSFDNVDMKPQKCHGGLYHQKGMSKTTPERKLRSNPKYLKKMEDFYRMERIKVEKERRIAMKQKQIKLQKERQQAKSNEAFFIRNKFGNMSMKQLKKVIEEETYKYSSRMTNEDHDRKTVLHKVCMVNELTWTCRTAIANMNKAKQVMISNMNIKENQDNISIQKQNVRKVVRKTLTNRTKSNCHENSRFNDEWFRKYVFPKEKEEGCAFTATEENNSTKIDQEKGQQITISDDDLDQLIKDTSDNVPASSTNNNGEVTSDEYNKTVQKSTVEVSNENNNTESKHEVNFENSKNPSKNIVPSYTNWLNRNETSANKSNILHFDISDDTPPHVKKGVKRKDFISTCPYIDDCLRAEGLIPDFSNFDDIDLFYDNFITVLLSGLQEANNTKVELDYPREVYTFLSAVTPRILFSYSQHEAYIIDQQKGFEAIWKETLKRRSCAHNKKHQKSRDHWKSQLDEITKSFNDETLNENLDEAIRNEKTITSSGTKSSFDEDNAIIATSSDLTAEEGKVDVVASGSGGGGDDDSSDSEDEDKDRKPSKSPKLSKKEKKRLKAKKKTEKSTSSSSSSSSDSEDEDKEYRSILNALAKSAKNYKIRELSMNPDPILRRERFNTWITDLKNVLSTHHKTSGLLDSYPSDLKEFGNDNIDRALKVFMSSITVGMAKRIVNNAKSAHQGLIDLRRNYGQTNKLDIHREKKAMMSMKQEANEPASDFLRRIRKQLDLCSTVGCNDFDEITNSDSLINIVLEGLNPEIRLYSTTVSTLKDRYRVSPDTLSLIYLEELFFDIDDKAYKRGSRHLSHQSIKTHRRHQYQDKKRESANYFHGQQQNQDSKRGNYNNYNKSNYKNNNFNQKKSYNKESKPPFDMSKVICYICKQPGHKANVCPQRRDKKVTFESAHVMKSEDEACKYAIDSSPLNEEYCSMSQECKINCLKCCCSWLCDIDVYHEDDIGFDTTQEVETSMSINETQETIQIEIDPPLLENMNRNSETNLVVQEDNQENNSLPSLISKYDDDSSDDDSANSSLNEEESISSNKVTEMKEIQNIDAYEMEMTREFIEEKALAALSRKIDAPAVAFAHGDFAKWLLDSGATSHFTPVLDDLLGAVELETPIYIRVADGSRMRATHRGIVELHFTSDEGIQVNLRLMRVLYVPGLQTRLFSIESFISDGRCSALYSRGSVKLRFANEINMTIGLPHIPPGSYVANTIHDISVLDGEENGFRTYIHRGEPRIEDFYLQVQPDGDTDTHFIGMAQETSTNEDPMSGGVDGATWKPTVWSERKLAPNSRQRMNVELGHRIFGHRAVSSLMHASNSEVWDDIKMVFAGDTWCDKCHIAVSPRQAASKRSMRIAGLPLQHLFIDCIPSPGVMYGVKECRAKDFYFVCCPNSKFVDKINCPDKSTATAIRLLDKWRGDMVKKGFQTFLYLRSDAGSQFTSTEFKNWCATNNIQLTIAGPKHQEQNSFVENAYRTCGRMARSMLINANLSSHFIHLALDYACLIMRVLPCKGLLDSNGKPTTTYEVLHKKKPRISRFKVFGCPVVFKRYQPQHDGDTTTTFRQLQRGSRGIFVGFPKSQAGWLIYVSEKIGNSHLIVSSDVSFDQHFLSGSKGIKAPFAGGETVRNLGSHQGRKGHITEETGDITNLAEVPVSHWGNERTFESEHKFPEPSVNRFIEEEKNDDLINDSSDDDSESDISYDDDDVDKLQTQGSIEVNGLRRSSRHNKEEDAFTACETRDLYNSCYDSIFQDNESALKMVEEACELEDIPIAPYLPEPKSIRDIKKLTSSIRDAWLKVCRKEVKFLIENDTFKKGEKPHLGDEIIPAIFVFKAKVTSRGFLDKLKARCVARGDMQAKTGDPDDLWSPCVFARTFKTFVAEAVRRSKIIKQLDFVGAFCQGLMKKRLFIQLPQEYAELVPEYAEYFNEPQLIQKSIYGTDFAAKVWNTDLTEWLTTNKTMKFIQSIVDQSLFVYRDNEGNYLFLIVYIDDCLYFGSNQETEVLFGRLLSERFKLDLQGWSHWFLGTRLYREKDGSYILDQENYVKHILNRYCDKESLWGLPRMQSTPAPVDYVYSKSNRPQNEVESSEIEKRFKGLSMASAVSSLLYAALNTRCDILWITNKLAKSSNNPGIKDYEALLHVFGYLRKYTSYGIRFYAKPEESPSHKICRDHNIEVTDLIGFSDSSWQDCPDTGKSTCGYKIFLRGGIIDAQSTMPVPVALSSAEAEYMGACNLGTMICHLRDLIYEFRYLGTKEYVIDGSLKEIPSVLLIDNQATVRMSKNYKVSAKNRHIARRWHFVRAGVQNKLFKLQWIPGDDQLADDCTKTQGANKFLPHFERTLIEIPEEVKGFKSNKVGNR